MFCILLTGLLRSQQCVTPLPGMHGTPAEEQFGFAWGFWLWLFCSHYFCWNASPEPFCSHYFKYYFILHPSYVSVPFIHILFGTKNHSNLN